MPATVTTTEVFPPTTTKAELKGEIALRIQAGAIRSWIDDSATKWTLKTEWNVLGKNDKIPRVAP